MMKKLFSLFGAACAVALFSMEVVAQNPRREIKADPSYSGCYYRSYPVPEADETAVPEGFTAFYISHYGRHGSRWVSDQKVYDRASEMMENAARENVLTPTGQELLEKLRIICEDARDRGGDLSPKGAMEHKGIAQRMYRNYPSVFKAEEPVSIHCISTLSPRCILSMAAFNEGLKELDPSLNLRREASKRHTYFMHNYEYTNDIYKASEAAGDSLIRAWVEPSRFLHSFISDEQYLAREIQDPQMAMFDLFHIASDMQCVDHLGIDLYKFFTDKELYQCWKALNGHTYMTEGPSFRYGDLLMANAKNLAADFVAKADEVLSGACHDVATLRFGHESNIVPFMALIGVKQVAVRTTAEQADKCWNTSEIVPMATNIQFIFFKNEAGAVKVRVLHNEKDAILPLEDGPFYDWTVLRAYLLEKADKTGLIEKRSSGPASEKAA